ncbi:MAG: ABC transporter permease subunit [Akkermansia sp.]|nr:ABC transporter permease subunit [Akkermansia sp.]
MAAILRSLAQTPARILAVAGVTFTQLVRMRLFLVLAVFGLSFLALQFLPYQGQLGVEFRGVQQLQLIKDVAMGCMQLFGLIFCVGATALLIPRDTEDRILYTILCKPVPRFDYLAGKALGVLGLLLAMLLLMDALMSALLWLREGSLVAELQAALEHQGIAASEMSPYIEQIHAAGNTADTQRAILAMLLGYGVLTTLTLLFSCFTSGTIVSMIFGLGAYFVGMFQGQLFTAIAVGSQEGTTPLMQHAQQVVSILLPDFSLFSLTDTAASGTPLSWGMLATLALIAAAYMLMHLLISAWIFAHKEF